MQLQDCCVGMGSWVNWQNAGISDKVFQVFASKVFKVAAMEK